MDNFVGLSNTDRIIGFCMGLIVGSLVCMFIATL